MSDNADAVRDHLNAAYQYAKTLNKPMLCYLIEMAALESEGIDTEVTTDERSAMQKNDTTHSTNEVLGNG